MIFFFFSETSIDCFKMSFKNPISILLFGEQSPELWEVKVQLLFLQDATGISGWGGGSVILGVQALPKAWPQENHLESEKQKSKWKS